MTPAPHLNDLDLTTNDITVLENAQEVRGFFARLGYDVDDAPSLPHAALGLDTDNLTPLIRQIWHVAASPDEEVDVYLFEVRSVTVSLTQQIARKFRDRVGGFLLILTSDYDRLDFVLLDRERASKDGVTGGTIRYTIRPRILTVDRHNPGPVAMRVLRRFTLTEPGGDYQWDKLRSAYTLADWSEPEFNNRALFSDYYLKHRVADEKLNPAWKENVRLVAGEVKTLIAGARQKYGGQPEREVRTGLIEPIFRLLGLDFTPVKAGDSSADTPDYTLHAPGAPDKPLALALTYAWNRNLDAVDPSRDHETPNENPGALVASLLEKAAAPWVIMTNGKLWRLYAASASNRVTNYYEIDLEEALFAPGADRESTFKYWWLLFRREAFTGFLDKVLAESQEYAKQIGERLKDRIFKRIFGYFAGGFIQHMRDQGIADADIDREAVFHATMTFLYRLMFILYAESLELLPVKEESGYGEHSLKRLKGEIASAGGAIEDDADALLKKTYRDNCCDLYGRLQTLFAAIDTGNPDLNLPMYNGGLFSPDTPEGQFLQKYAIPDVYVALGLDRLARDRDDKTQALVFIDFKSLGVRQLGSIYEGLLEFKLRIADQKLAVIREKGRELYMPYAQAKKAGKNVIDEVKPGRVYIENTKQERKATGSYYTPDYIVKYIVQHAVGPVLDEKFKALRDRLHDAQKRYRQFVAANTPHPKSLPHKEGGTFKTRAEGTSQTRAAGTSQTRAGGTFRKEDNSDSSSPLPSSWGKGSGDGGADRWDISPALERKMQEVARQFRKSLTPAEDTLWQALRKEQLGAKFRRQMSIGPFIADFYCSSARLVVEVDGPIHQSQREADRQRQALIESLGITVVRFTNEQVFNDLITVLASIRTILAALSSLDTPSSPLPPLWGKGPGDGGVLPGPGDGGNPPDTFWTTPAIQQLADDCLNVRVLDPAMGSGHFLVEVVDYISNRLLDFLNAWTDNPVRALIERTRADILAEMERQGVSIDPARLTDVALLRRAVLKRCVYGVDLNPMAVELAKVSLWLDAFTLGAPLSFLDHHLKCGNSLIGARVKEAQSYLAENTTGMVDMFAGSEFAGVMLATDLMRQVSYLSDNTASQVAQSRAQYKQAGEHLAPFKRLLDVYTSRWFGNSPRPKSLPHKEGGAFQAKSGGPSNASPSLPRGGRGRGMGGKTDSVKLFLQDAKIHDWLKNPSKLPAKGLLGNEPEIAATALQASAQYRFFHWELEFPEVFFAPSTPGGQDVQLREDGGFDAVVGNPPYDVMEKAVGELRPAELDAFAQYLSEALLYKPALGGKLNIFRFFLVLWVDLIRPTGEYGLIIPLSVATDLGCANLRRWLLTEHRLHQLDAFPDRYDPHARVFEEAKTSVAILRGASQPDEMGSVTVMTRAGASLQTEASCVTTDRQAIEDVDPVGFTFPLTSQAVWDLMLRIHRDPSTARLREVAETGAGEVHLTYYKPHFTSNPSDREVVRGAEIQRYFLSETLQQGEKLYLNLRNARRVGLTPKEFDELRIGMQRLTGTEDSYRLLACVIDPTVHLAHTTQYIVPRHPHNVFFLLALHLSRLLDRRFRVTSGTTNVGVYELEQLPIRRIAFTTPPDRRAQLADEGRALYLSALAPHPQSLPHKGGGTSRRAGDIGVSSPLPSLWGKGLGDGGSGAGDGGSGAGGWGDVLAFTAERLAADESDAVHDLLAHLAEQMIALNKQKQAEVKRFLGWLEARLRISPHPKSLPHKEGGTLRQAERSDASSPLPSLWGKGSGEGGMLGPGEGGMLGSGDGGAGIDSLTGKTILQGYLGDYQKGEPETPFEDFFYRLHQNWRRFGVSLSDLKAEIEDEYRKSLDVLLPIKARLAATDALIDRVVYQLYGLTDDEIRLIEYPGLEQAVASARQDVLKEKDVEPASDEAVEKIAAKVGQAAGQYLARVDESQIEAELRAEIPGWDGLPGNVRTFLITGELLLRQSALPDYSPVVISFGKAAEVALNERLFVPFRASHHEADCDNPVLRRFMAGTKTLSLGAMPIVLASSGERALRAFVTTRYPNAARTILSQTGLLARLTQDQIDRYRNSAAHDAVLTADDARAARQWAIEILGYV